jgi:hypothetical protein
MAIKTAVISATSDGDNTVVAAVSGKKIRVVGYVLNVNAAGTVQWKSGASTALSGAMELVDGGGVSAPMVTGPGRFWFQTASGEALVLATAAGVDGLGHVAYETVQA